MPHFRISHHFSTAVLAGLTAIALGSVCPAADGASPEVRERCLVVLREGLKSDEFWPAMHAAEALTLDGHPDEVRQALEPKLPAEEDDQRRCGLARELVRAGDRVKRAVLLDVLAAEDDYGHTHAAESLFKVAEVGDGELLRNALKSAGSSKLQIMAAAALARCGNPLALAVVRKEVGSDDPELSRTAAWVLGQIGDSSDVSLLREGLARAEDDFSRAYFQHALAMLGDDAGRQALAANLGHEDPAVRTYAANFAGDARATGTAAKLAELLEDPVLDVRVRAAQSLLVLSQPAQSLDGIIVRDVYPATAANPRYSEGSILELHDGSLLYATTEFVGGGSDFSSARIVGRTSGDGGRAWGEPRVLQEQTGKQNVMSVTLRWLDSPVRETTPSGMFYLVKNSPSDLKVYLRISADGAKTFGEPILVTPEPGYHVMNNDRVLRLSTGRLLAPVASSADVFQENHFVSSCWLSDDAGQTWRRGKGHVDLPRRGAMEPECFEATDGRVGIILRTQLGHIGIAWSEDGGDTWSEPHQWSVKAPEAPATVRRIPSTGDLLLVWNNTFEQGTGHGGKRTPLTAALSADDGRTWKHLRNLETDPNQTYAYTSLAFVSDRALLGYYVRDESTSHISSRFRSLPVAWFYGEQDEAAAGR